MSTGILNSTPWSATSSTRVDDDDDDERDDMAKSEAFNCPWRLYRCQRRRFKSLINTGGYRRVKGRISSLDLFFGVHFGWLFDMIGFLSVVILCNASSFGYLSKGTFSSFRVIDECCFCERALTLFEVGIVNCVIRWRVSSLGFFDITSRLTNPLVT